MRRLVPSAREERLEATYADVALPGTPEQPAISLGMVASIDGAATLGGHTADLGGAADAVAFRALRDACDAVLVGAGTIRAEDYGPGTVGARRRAAREARGLAPAPRLVIVTGTLDLDPDRRVFSRPDARPLLLTRGSVPAAREARLAEVADVVRVGGDEVDLAAAVDHLGGLGLGRILCEGGPTLNQALLTADLVTDVFLTIAPVIVGGPGPRIVASLGAEVRRPFSLLELREHEGELLLRYRRTDDGAAA